MLLTLLFLLPIYGAFLGLMTVASVIYTEDHIMHGVMSVIKLSGYGDEISPDLEVQMDILASEGISYIDLRSVEDKNVLKLTDEEIADIKKRLDARGFKVASIASPIGKVDINDAFAPHLKDFMRAIHLAKYFDTRFIRIFSFLIPKGEKPYKYRNEVFRRMKELTCIAEQEGITLVFKNEMKTYGDNGERARDILEYVNSAHLRFAFDPANFIQVQVLPMTDAYPYVESYIDYIHIKDARMSTGEIVPAGEGDGELRKLIFALKEKNYSGFMSIEPHLEAEGKYQGFSKPQLFILAVKALKNLLIEAGLKWKRNKDCLFQSERKGSMRYCIAKNGETLKDIAVQKEVTLEELISLNPHLASLGVNISNRLIKLPPLSERAENRQPAEFAPPPTDFRREWIPLTPLEKMEQTDYDVLIVGSGAGGGALLWRLCQQWGANGKKIGVVEAGDLLLQTHFFNIPTMTYPRYESYFDKVSTRIQQFRMVVAFGGRTLFWGAAAPRMPVSEIARWPVPVSELQSYYSIAEQVMKVNPFFQEGSYLTTILLNRLQEQGYPHATRLPVAVDLEPTKYGQIHSNAFFSSIALYAEALNRRPFDLAVNSRAVEILTEQKRVTGIRVMSADKRSHILKAKTIVLSASTFETPRLLLASGIPGRAIGHYLTDNSVVGGRSTLSRRHFPEVLGNLGILIPGGEGRPYQIIIDGPDGYFAYQQYQIKSLQDQLEFRMLAFGLTESRFENRIELDPEVRDEYGVPVIRVHFSYSEKDKALIRKIEEEVRQVYSTLQVPGASQAPLRLFTLEAIHDAGTCRMGYDPDTSATDPYGQIHGISGLYVADNSVMPFSGTANPTLTTVALAIRTADHLIRQLK